MALALCFVFFLSGASALVFETLWFRQAGLMLGNSVWASSLVLASFMAGLALGNALAARHGDRLRRPLLVYARLEAGVGISGLALVLLFPALTPLLAPAFRALAGHVPLLNGLRLTIAFLLMLFPATAMGVTLPILARALSRSDPNFGRVLGRLYGWNTLGAVAGALGSEMLLVDAFGVRGTGVTAALLNAAAALAAVWLSPRFEALAGGAAGPEPPGAALRGSARLLAVAFLSGAILLALEGVWFRFLLLFIEGTTAAFAAMLSVVLLGIAVGGLAAAWWLKWQPEAERFLPLLALAAGVATIVTYVGFSPGNAPVFRGPLQALYASAHLMLPTSLLSGALFALLGKAVKRRVVGAARAAGVLTLANTVGAMTGALAGGFLLLPGLGMERSFFGLAAAYGLVALGLLGASPGRQPASEQKLLAVSGAIFVVVLALFPFGLMRNHYLRRLAGRWAAEGAKIVGIREGLSETLLYLRVDRFEEPIRYRLVTNGISMSGTGSSSARYMKLFVYWPIALHPDAKRALLISYGVGATAEALTDTAGLESIDVVDISREILEMGGLMFPPGHRPPLADSRVSTHVEDGRFFLLTTERRYDLITAEPPPPKMAGIVNLYSKEYFQLVYDRLAEGGIATYWLPLHQLYASDTRAIVRAFCDAFADCSLWTALGPEYMLVGTRNARGPKDAAAFGRQWSDPVVGPEMRALGLERPEQLGTLFLGDAAFLAELTRGDAPLDDDHPYRLSNRPIWVADATYIALTDTALTRPRFEQSALIRRLWPEAIREATLAAFPEQEIVNRFAWSAYGAGKTSLKDIHKVLTGTDLHTLVVWLMGSTDEEQRAAARAAARGMQDLELDQVLGIGAMARRDYRAAAQHFARAQPQAVDPERLAQWRVLALGLANDTAGAAAVMRAAQGSPRDQAGWTWLAQTLGIPQ